MYLARVPDQGGGLHDVASRQELEEGSSGHDVAPVDGLDERPHHPRRRRERHLDVQRGDLAGRQSRGAGRVERDSAFRRCEAATCGDSEGEEDRAAHGLSSAGRGGRGQWSELERVT